MRLYIEIRHARRRPGLDPRVQKAIAVQDALSSLSPGTGEDSTKELRAWRESRG
jgi:hypothetical protein